MLVPAASDARAQANQDEICVVAGTGWRGSGPFPAPAANFADFENISDLAVDVDGEGLVVTGYTWRNDTALVRIDSNGSASVALAQGQFVAGVQVGDIVDVAVDTDNTVLVLTDQPNALFRLVDGQPQNASQLLAAGLTTRHISLAPDGTMYSAIVGASGPELLRSVDGGHVAMPLPDLFFGAAIGLQIAAVPGGAWVVMEGSLAEASSYLVFVGDDGVSSVGESFETLRAPSGLAGDGNGVLYTLRSDGLIPGQIRRAEVGQVSTLVRSLDSAISGRMPRPVAIDTAGSMTWFTSGEQVYGIGTGGCPSVAVVAGPPACLVADASTIGASLPASSRPYTPLDLAVDGRGTVYASWFASTGRAGFGTPALTSITGDGTVTDLLATGSAPPDRPLGTPTHVAVSETTGDVVVSDYGIEDSRVLRRTSDGAWDVVLAAGDTIGGPGAPIFDGSGGLALVDNDNLYVRFLFTNVLKTTLSEPRTPQAFGPNFAGLRSVAVTSSSGPNPTVWAAFGELGSSRPVYKQDQSGEFAPVGDLSLLVSGGSPAQSATALAPSGDAVIASVYFDRGATRLVRLSADGSVTPLVDETMTLDGLVLGFVRAIDTSPNGDVFLLDATNDRLIRIPASGDCNTPPDPLVSVAASVNCDDRADIVDALLIAQYAARIRMPVQGCPLANPVGEINVAYADINGDRSVDIVDALLVAQCAARRANEACPS